MDVSSSVQITVRYSLIFYRSIYDMVEDVELSYVLLCKLSDVV